MTQIALLSHAAPQASTIDTHAEKTTAPYNIGSQGQRRAGLTSLLQRKTTQALMLLPLQSTHRSARRAREEVHAESELAGAKLTRASELSELARKLSAGAQRCRDEASTMRATAQKLEEEVATQAAEQRPGQQAQPLALATSYRASADKKEQKALRIEREVKVRALGADIQRGEARLHYQRALTIMNEVNAREVLAGDMTQLLGTPANILRGKR